MFSVIVVSAGKSQRYRGLAGHAKGNKTLELIGNIPVFLLSLLLFKNPKYREIILTVSPEDHDNNTYQQVLSRHKEVSSDLTDRLHIVPGGAERFHSVWAGLSRCSTSSRWVLIHDAARPLLHRDDLSRIETAMESRQNEDIGILPVTHPIDTIKQVDSQGWVTGNLSRPTLRAASTPQCFPTAALKQAYQAHQSGVNEKLAIPTDDSEVYSNAGHPVLTLNLNHPNPKLTTRDDYEYMLRLWEGRKVGSKTS